MGSLEETWQYVQNRYGLGEAQSTHKKQSWQRMMEAARSADLGEGNWRALRAPGRVNLIGEHTDYNGLPVMPMALDREVIAFFQPSQDGMVRLSSIDPAFGPRDFVVTGQITPFPAGDWGNYAKAAVQALREWAAALGRKADCGFKAIVAGDVPSGAGLSSSSALVVAMALAFADVNSLEINRREMADLMAAGERFVGTQGGGMDQAVCLMAENGQALQIEFNPTRATPRPLPPGCEVVIAHSMVRAEKSAAARVSFNLRAAEGRLAAALIGLKYHKDVHLLADVFSIEPDDPVGVIEGAIRPNGYTLDELAESLSLSPDELKVRYLAQRDGGFLEEPPNGFQPYRRARHVVTEACRVWRAAEAMQAGDTQTLGDLMIQSHISCRDDYEISCPELDALMDIAVKAGVYGARLTGAGFGGCIVALTNCKVVKDVMADIESNYYSGWLKANRRVLAEHAEAIEIGQRLFATRPQPGAELFK